MNVLTMVVSRVLFPVFFFCASTSLQAADAPFVSSDPVLEKRVIAVTSELRCLVCQNQTIADSHSELAIDLKNQVREMLVQGKSEKDIKRFMVERYGEFVLYRPEVKSTTWFLWMGPFVLLIGGLSFLFFRLRQRNKTLAEAGEGLSAEARLRAERLLGVAPTASTTSPEIDPPSGTRKD
jgi:cytochrome c-type biogenesis protein CcmH